MTYKEALKKYPKYHHGYTNAAAEIMGDNEPFHTGSDIWISKGLLFYKVVQHNPNNKIIIKSFISKNRLSKAIEKSE